MPKPTAFWLTEDWLDATKSWCTARKESHWFASDRRSTRELCRDQSRTPAVGMRQKKRRAWTDNRKGRKSTTNGRPDHQREIRAEPTRSKNFLARNRRRVSSAGQVQDQAKSQSDHEERSESYVKTPQIDLSSSAACFAELESSADSMHRAQVSIRLQQLSPIRNWAE